MTLTERQLEELFIAKLRDLRYAYREDSRDRAGLECNFRKKFEALNRAVPPVASRCGPRRRHPK